MIPGVGVKMPSQGAWVNYALNNADGSCAFTNCAGEFSLLVTGVDDGSPGDKSKIFSMQEGPDLGDITDDDYRMTAELRGRNYPAPGTISGRIIPGDGSQETSSGKRKTGAIRAGTSGSSRGKPDRRVSKSATTAKRATSFMT